MNTKNNQSETEEARRREEEAGITDESNTADQTESALTEEESAENPVASKGNDSQHEKEKYLRLVAEFENYKKRTLRDRMDLIKSAGQEVIASLLPVMDDFERAIKNTPEDNQAREGLMLVYHKFKNVLEQNGLKAMETTGQVFDTDLHEAITSVPGPEKMKGHVVDEAEKGYFLNGKVLRHAKVVVGA